MGGSTSSNGDLCAMMSWGDELVEYVVRVATLVSSTPTSVTIKFKESVSMHDCVAHLQNHFDKRVVSYDNYKTFVVF